MEENITRVEHDEFSRRIGEEHKRINRRLDILEKNTEKLNALNTSIEKLALNMESMLKEQVQQGKRLSILERRDGEMWRNAMKYVLSAVLGAVIGYISNKF